MLAKGCAWKGISVKRREVETLHSADLCAMTSDSACPLWVSLGPARPLDAVVVDAELAKRTTGSRRRSVLGDPRELGPLADGASMDLPHKAVRCLTGIVESSASSMFTSL